MFRQLILLFGLLVGPLMAAEPLEFCAYLRVGSQELFILGDSGTGKSSEWLRAGQSFSGYTITRFDAKTETLLVTGDGRTLTLLLRTEKHRDSEHEDGAALTLRLEMAKDVLKTMHLRFLDGHPTVKAQLSYIAELERMLAEQATKR